MKKWLLPVLLGSLLIFSACSQNARLTKKTQKNLNKGNYEEAIQDIVKTLKKNPDNDVAQDLLVKTWQSYCSAKQKKIENIIQSSEINKWEQVYQEYTALQKTGEEIQTLPPLLNPYSGYRVTIEIPDYTEQIKQSKENAAAAHYQTGIRYAKISNDREMQKKAALEFKAALNLIPDYQDADLRYEQCRKLAIKRIAVSPFADKSNTSGKYGAVSDILTDYIVSRLISTSVNNEFIEIIARSQLETVMKEQQLSASGLVNETGSVRLGQILGANEILTGSILQISVSPERTVSVQSEDEKEVVLRTEEYIDADGTAQEKEIKGKVYCRYRKYTKTASVSVSTSYSILDVETGKIILQETLEVKNPFSDTWARKISGDDRALSNNTKKLLEKAEPFPPSVNEMILETLKNTGNDIINKVSGYLLQ